MRPPSDHLLRSGRILLVRAAEPSAPVVDGLYRIYNAHADPVDSDSCFPDTTTVFGRPQDRERRWGIRAYQGGEGPSRPDPPRVLSSCRGNGGTSVRKTTSWAAIVLALCTGVGAFESPAELLALKMKTQVLT